MLSGIIAASDEPLSEVAPLAFFIEPKPAAAAATGLGGSCYDASRWQPTALCSSDLRR